MEPPDVKRLFDPRSVAVIGASSKANKIGNILMQNLIHYQFSGAIHPVSIREKEVMGLKAYTSIEDVPEPVDCSIIASPAPSVLEVVESCVKKRVKFAIIVAAGFGETGPEGTELEKRLVKTANEGGLRLIGPNSAGVVNRRIGFAGTIMPIENWRDGGVSLVSQSGVFVGALADWVMDYEHFGIGKSISLGNKCDLNESELLEYFAADRHTRVVGMYVEGFRNGRKFIEVAQRITKIKPVVIVKSGRTDVGAKVAISHTGSIADNDTIVDAVLRQAGLIRVYDLQELFDIVKAFDYQPLPCGPKVGIFTLSGAAGVMTTDVLAKYGLRLADFSDSTVKNLSAGLMDSENLAKNPLDIFAALRQESEEAHTLALRLVSEDQNVDAVIGILLASELTRFDVEKVFQKESAKRKTILVAIIGGQIGDGWFNALESMRIPVYLGPSSFDRAAKVLGILYRYRNSIAKDVKSKRHVPHASSQASL